MSILIKLGYEYSNLIAVRSLSWLAENESLHGLKFKYEGRKEISEDEIGYFYADESGSSMAIIINKKTEEAFFACDKIESSIEKKIVDWVKENMDTN